MSELQMQYQQSNNTGVTAQSSSSREMEEVKGQIFMARQFPRDVFQSEQRILDACKRPALAEVAVYRYPRGGSKVEGPSIRLAEVLAQNTNVRQEKVFTVKHSRKANGSVQKLTDPRDIYEMVANQGARRVRSCVLSIIPGDITEKATEECNRTLQGNNKEPLKERLANALSTFKDKYRVTKEQIEEHMGYNISAFTERDYVDLIKIFTSLRDGMSKPDDWFKKEVKNKQESKLSEAFKADESKTMDKEEKETDKPKTEEVKADDDEGTQQEIDFE
nr:hypothetical protein JUJ52_18915 [Virgibacillus sp. AGTR]